MKISHLIFERKTYKFNSTFKFCSTQYICRILVKHPPLPGFLSPSGGAALSAPILKKKNWGARCAPHGAAGSAPFSGVEKKIGPPTAPQMVLGTWPVPWNSKYVLGFEIGQRESDFYSERTDTQSDTAIQYGFSI